MVRALVIADGDMAEKGNATNFLRTPSSHGYYGDPDSIIALI